MVHVRYQSSRSDDTILLAHKGIHNGLVGKHMMGIVFVGNVDIEMNSPHDRYSAAGRMMMTMMMMMMQMTLIYLIVVLNSLTRVMKS